MYEIQINNALSTDMLLSNSVLPAWVIVAIFAIVAAAGVTIAWFGFWSFTVNCQSGKRAEIGYGSALQGGSTYINQKCN